MNLLPMHYFTIVVEKESINQAARELHITQQTLSTHMAALEKELGCILFERRPKFRLTYAGEKFYQYALSFARTYSSMIEEFSELRDAETGILKVGIAHTRGRVLLPEVLSQFTKGYPYVQIQLHEMNNHMLSDCLSNGDIDLAIGDIPNDIPEFSTCDLYQEELLLLIHKSLYAETEVAEAGLLKPSLPELHKAGLAQLPLSAAAVAKLAQLPFLMGAQDDIAGRMGKQFLKNKNIVPRVIAVSDNIETLLAMCLQGLGAVFCPDRLLVGAITRAERDELRIITWEQRYHIRIAWLNGRYITNSMHEFIAVCKKQIPPGLVDKSQILDIIDS